MAIAAHILLLLLGSAAIRAAAAATRFPTRFPSRYPSVFPTSFPSRYPSSFPSRRPPSPYPTTKWPTKWPSRTPTKFPSHTAFPTTKYPTRWPTTKYPSQWPTRYPTAFPSRAATERDPACYGRKLPHAATPPGVHACVFADGIAQPRGLAIPDGGRGDVLVLERGRARVVALWDTDGDGVADGPSPHPTRTPHHARIFIMSVSID